MKDTIDYRQKWQAIKSSVDWKPSNARKYSKNDKRVISQYFQAIGKLRGKGYSPVGVKRNVARTVNRNAMIALPKLKQAWVKVPKGAKARITNHGETVGWSIGAIIRYWVPATFFRDDEYSVEDADVIEEGDRVVGLLRKALGKRKMHRIAIAYLGGDGPTMGIDLIYEALMIDSAIYGEDNEPQMGIAGFHFKAPKDIAKKIEALKKDTAARNAARRKAARGD